MNEFREIKVYTDFDRVLFLRKCHYCGHLTIQWTVPVPAEYCIPEYNCTVCGKKWQYIETSTEYAKEVVG